MKNPWLKPAPPGWGIEEIALCVVSDRLRELKDFDAEKLRSVIEWPGTQQTVRVAAERRLRKLNKEVS